ncbi:hypothetical protein GE061_003070 [Apolygus lucorum]|uniref:Uncharacterized protein n=1 Tax=Apolygus lucorum TaxID=248454 RepID=A0A6A4JUR5_APOLU|nr:hypothetical protein GE061_003070 [Apolygus lucorum]
MYKLVVALPLFFAAVSAGIIGAPYSHGGLALAHSAPIYASPVVHAPLVHAPILAHAPLATSYSNSYRVVHDSVPVVKTVAIAHQPLIAHQPIALTLGHGGYLHH